MPTIITHSIVAIATLQIINKNVRTIWLWIGMIVVSILPDADVISFTLGIKYGDFFGHRGFFHSLFFSLLISFIIMLFLRKLTHFEPGKWWKYVVLLFCVGASHGILDAFTNGGLGIALLAPFDTGRYFFPWTPIPVAPIGLRPFFSSWGLRVIGWEFVIIILPLFTAVLIIKPLIRICQNKRIRSK